MQFTFYLLLRQNKVLVIRNICSEFYKWHELILPQPKSYSIFSVCSEILAGYFESQNYLECIWNLSSYVLCSKCYVFLDHL